MEPTTGLRARSIAHEDARLVFRKYERVQRA
jgi:hypothetical protein